MAKITSFKQRNCQDGAEFFKPETHKFLGFLKSLESYKISQSKQN